MDSKDFSSSNKLGLLYLCSLHVHAKHFHLVGIRAVARHGYQMGIRQVNIWHTQTGNLQESLLKGLL